MKILFYISTISGGGSARVLTNLANQFVFKGENVIIATLLKETNTDYELDNRIKRIVLDKDKLSKNVLVRLIKRVAELRKCLIVEKADIVVSFLAETNIRMLLATLGLRCKKIVSVRSDPIHEYYGFVKCLLVKLLFRYANGIVVQNEIEKEWFSKSLQRKIKIIKNQVSEKFFNVIHLSDDYFVATGRLDAAKNYEFMIKTFSKFLKLYPLEKLFIYGDGDKKEKLLKLIDELEVKDNIILCGISKDIPKILSHAKCFLLTSDYEGMPNGLLEAMAIGLPCISTDCDGGGPKSLINNNENGILVKKDDEKELLNSLIKIENDKKFREKLAKNAKKSAELFKPEKVFKEWDTYIRSLQK